MKTMISICLLMMLASAIYSQEAGCISGNCENGGGTYVYANGYRYEGDFVNGMREGRGLLTEPDGGSYDGMWSDDEFNGQGTYKWPDGARYTGEWKNGIQDGYGIYFYPNGDKYTGYFKNNKFHGTGTYTWVNGQSFTGSFENGEMIEPDK
jgi:hypothetical protein